jgi:hypothetical protein
MERSRSISALDFGEPCPFSGAELAGAQLIYNLIEGQEQKARVVHGVDNYKPTVN